MYCQIVLKKFHLIYLLEDMKVNYEEIEPVSFVSDSIAVIEKMEECIKNELRLVRYYEVDGSSGSYPFSIVQIGDVDCVSILNKKLVLRLVHGDTISEAGDMDLIVYYRKDNSNPYDVVYEGIIDGEIYDLFFEAMTHLKNERERVYVYGKQRNDAECVLGIFQEAKKS